MSQVQGECGSSAQAKQKRAPHAQTGSQCGSPSQRSARPQCGTLGHQRTSALSCTAARSGASMLGIACTSMCNSYRPARQERC